MFIILVMGREVFLGGLLIDVGVVVVNVAIMVEIGWFLF